MAVKPYQEGKTWSFRLRMKGQEIYRTGFATEAEARKEAERLRQKIAEAGQPKNGGPWRTTLGQALQAYALERLPFMKGAVQDACRINRYLRLCGLDVIKVSEALPDMARLDDAKTTDALRWEVGLEPARKARKVPQGLHAHRQRQAIQKTASDRLRKQLAQTPMAQVMSYQVQDLIDTMGRDGSSPATIGLERALLRRIFNYANQSLALARAGTQSRSVSQAAYGQ